MLDFGLNQVTMSGAPLGQFVDTAADLGCVGVELRNDLERPVFDGLSALQAGASVRAAGLRLLGLSQVYPFNRWSGSIADDVRLLIDMAQEAGAETISLIPANDGGPADALAGALENILPLLDDTGLVALVEPLGFAQASLRFKAELDAAITTLGAGSQVKLVHDTFHHALASEPAVFAARTGLVHLSGVVSPARPVAQMEDADRVLVTPEDRLGTLDQIETLLAAGYDGVFSFECFAPEIRDLDNPIGAIGQSIHFISSHLQQRAA